MSLADALHEGVQRNRDGIALRELDGGAVTYRELDELVERIAAALVAAGAGPDDRIAVWLPKSIGAVAAMQAALRIGAAYVPVDAAAPAERARRLLADCAPAVCVCDERRLAVGPRAVAWQTVLLTADGEPLHADGEPLHADGAHASTVRRRPPDALAYILYTSGSTGTPKGVCVSDRNARAFVDWAYRELAPGPDDRFANHAGLHFDLSVLDLYAAFRAGAEVLLIPENVGFVPERLVAAVAEHGVTVWYSVPSALALMIDRGGLLETERPPRAILFAGEPFPIEYVRRLRVAFPGTRLLNLYGPTETNVCTFQEVHDVADDRTAPVPIGSPCCGNRAWSEDGQGEQVPVGGLGELVVDGPTVMLGYWGSQPHDGPYRTGDFVRRIGTDSYEYVGRRDSLVKVRGHRVELGEVEAVLDTHPDVRQTAVVAVGSGLARRLVGFVVSGDSRPTLLDVKRHLAERLPRGSVVHEVAFVDRLPRTANGKIDRRALARGLEGATDDES